MKKMLLEVFVLLMAILALLLLCGQQPTAAQPLPAAGTATPLLTPQPTPTPQPTGELRHEKITSQALAGNLVGDPVERGYNIYLPPSYAEGNKRYPVVHILHGGLGNEYQFLMLKDVYERMLQKGVVQEMILVFSDGNNKFRASNYISSPTIGDYETYIAHELVAQIDAKYRTIPDRDSRGITGCSMGGDGSMHLALTFPDVYNVVVPMSATYDFANDPTIPEVAASFTHIPQDFNDLDRYWYVGNGNTAFYISLAAGAASNSDKPPFYLDMPFEIVDGKGRIIPEVWKKIAAVDEVHDLEEYLQQSTRLDHILLYHGEFDDTAPVELARSFDQLLTARGVDHEYVEVERGSHCSYDMKPVLQFLSDHLVGEQSAVVEVPTAKPTPQRMVESIRETITSQALAGNLIGDPAERTVYVVLPPGYAASEKRYPVLYVLPWGDGYPAENASGFKWTMNSLLRKGEIQEMIVVVPDGNNKLGASHFRSSPTIGDYEAYLTQEVVNYIDTHYRTLPTRDSRGLGGCSNGGGPAMRLGFKYPNIFSVVAPTDGVYDESLEVWPTDVETVQQLKELPQDIMDLKLDEMVAWYVQMAAGSAPDPDNPPFYSEMPIRIVNGRGEFVPEVVAKIVENDAMHEARRYVEQPIRLQGILIRHALQDTDYSQSVRSFEQLLTDLGIEHEYVEVESNHCGYGWEAASLKYMSEKLAFTATVSAPSLTPTVITSRPAADIVAETDVFLNKLVKFGLFSGDVLIAHNGEVIFHKAYGMADRDKQTLITNQTRFYLASLTKQFTAAAIMLLEQEGKLKVQDSICQYLPHCPDDWKPITIHHLLTHTAGLPYAPGLPYSKPVSSAELWVAAEQSHLLSKPGESYEYSDVGYILAGLIVEQVSGQSYGEFLQEHIFGPAGMSNTGYGDGGEQLAIGYATSSIKAARFEPTVDHGAGGVYSTAEDLLKWDQALYTDTPLTAASREGMFTPYTVATTFGPDIEYGYGWCITGEQEYQVISHGGTAPGFQTELARHINDHITVIVLANLEASSSTGITERILSIIFGTRSGMFRTP